MWCNGGNAVEKEGGDWKSGNEPRVPYSTFLCLGEEVRSLGSVRESIAIRCKGSFGMMNKLSPQFGQT